MSNNKSISNYNGSSLKKKQYDRFIPHTVTKSLFLSDQKTKGRSNNYQQLLGQRLFEDKIIPKILQFGNENEQKQNISPNHTRTNHTKLPQQPYKVLPAVSLKDDFYLNLLDWGQTGRIAVALQSSLFLWSGCATRVAKIHDFRNQGQSLCSVKFQPSGTKVTMGLNRGDIAHLDLQKKNYDKYQDIHLGRIGSIGCTSNLICSGGRDGYVSIRDLRQSQQIFRYKAHNQEICGLKLSPAGDMIATGGNDNKLHLFSIKKMETLVQWTDHTAAVKALDFNPSDPTIISGGGSADRKLKIYSLHSLQLLNSIDTGSQVCNLVYSPISSHLLTTHGYSLNELTLWRWGLHGQLQKLDSVMGHKRRVLYLSGEGKGGRVVTGAGDEELHMWKVFGESKTSQSDDLR